MYQKFLCPYLQQNIYYIHKLLKIKGFGTELLMCQWRNPERNNDIPGA